MVRTILYDRLTARGLYLTQGSIATLQLREVNYMAGDMPGLQPRKLEGEVAVTVESDRLPELSTELEKPSVETPVQTEQVAENTQPSQEETKEDESQEQPTSQRAEQRIQTLANEKSQAEARAQQAEAMLQRLVNVQVQQPVQSEAETLAKQYRSYNPALGYPEDPKEFANFNTQQARLAAADEANKHATRQREQMETGELLRAYPNAQDDPVLLGAVAALRSQAQSRGGYLSYKDAADIASKDLDSRVSKKVVEQVTQGNADKNEAYVESTRGASMGRVTPSTPDPKNMTLKEKEAWLKESGNW